MTDEQIAKLYDQALIIESNGDYVAGELDPVKFAKLVAEHERERIFSELFEMHLKAQRIHNHYLHAVMHIKAKDKAKGEA